MSLKFNSFVDCSETNGGLVLLLLLVAWAYMTVTHVISQSGSGEFSLNDEQ